MSASLFFSIHCVYDSFIDYLSYGKQNHIDTSQPNGILKVFNFYYVEDIPVVFCFAYEFYQACISCTAAGVISVVLTCMSFLTTWRIFHFDPHQAITCLSG